MLLRQLRPTLRGPRLPPPEVTLRSMVLRMSRIHSAWAWEQHRNSNVRRRCLSRAHKVSVMSTNHQLLSPIWIHASTLLWVRFSSASTSPRRPASHRTLSRTHPSPTRLDSPSADSSRSTDEPTKYFSWEPEDVARLVDVICKNTSYQRALLPGRLTASQEKGLKTNKDVLFRQVYKEVFPGDPSPNPTRIKVKLRWLLQKYNTLKKSLSQTGSGLLFREMGPDHSVSVLLSRERRWCFSDPFELISAV